jgi:hypothetical protein
MNPNSTRDPPLLLRPLSVASASFVSALPKAADRRSFGHSVNSALVRNTASSALPTLPQRVMASYRKREKSN